MHPENKLSTQRETLKPLNLEVTIVTDPQEEPGIQNEADFSGIG